MKRFFVFVLVLLLVIPCLMFCVSAAETYTYTWDGLRLSGFCPPDGTYDFCIYSSVTDTLYVSESPLTLCWDDISPSHIESCGCRLYSMASLFGSFLLICEETGETKNYSIEVDSLMECDAHYDRPMIIEMIVNGDFASEGCYATFTAVGAEDASDLIAPILSTTGNVAGVVNSLFDLISANPLFSALCAGSLILICLPIYRDSKKSMR